MHLGGISYSGQGSQSLLYYVARDNLGKIHTYNRTFYIRKRVVLGNSFFSPVTHLLLALPFDDFENFCMHHLIGFDP